jgi:hypothetical protein
LLCNVALQFAEQGAYNPSMTDREYLKLRAKLDADYQSGLAALDTVFKMTGGDPQAVIKAAASAKKESNTTRTVRGELSTAISRVLPELGSEQFTASHVLAQLKLHNPGMEIKDSSVSSALVRLTDDDGPLEVVAEGKGRRATIYRKRAAQRAQKAG